MSYIYANQWTGFHMVLLLFLERYFGTEYNVVIVLSILSICSELLSPILIVVLSKSLVYC